jgi:hypothetical protein
LLGKYLVEKHHRISSWHAMIIEKYDINDEKFIEEEEKSKEMQDLDKTSPTKEQFHNDKMNKSFLLGPFRNSQMRHSTLN